MRLRSSLPSVMVILVFCIAGIATLFLIEALQSVDNQSTRSLETVNEQMAADPVSIQTELENAETEQNVSQSVNLTQLLNRPLVSQTRRMPIIKAEEFVEAPVEEAKVEPPVIIEQPPPPDIQMLGSFTDINGAAALVLLETGAEVWVRRGAKIDAWVVQSITPQTLTLQLDRESVDINTID